MSQPKAVYLTVRADPYSAADDLFAESARSELSQRAHRWAVGLLCEMLLEELDGPISDLGRRVQKLADEVRELERTVNGSTDMKRINGYGCRRMYEKRKRLGKGAATRSLDHSDSIFGGNGGGVDNLPGD